MLPSCCRSEYDAIFLNGYTVKCRVEFEKKIGIYQIAKTRKKTIYRIRIRSELVRLKTEEKNIEIRLHKIQQQD